MGRPEGNLRDIAKTWLNSQPYTKVIVNHGSIYSEHGTPDILGTVNGRTIALEFKSATGYIRPTQKIRLKQWKRAGAVTAEIRTLEDVKALHLIALSM